MRMSAAGLLALAGAVPLGAAEPVGVPSGQSVAFVEVIDETSGGEEAVVRFRFLAPAIAGGGAVDAEAALGDMAALCDSFALPWLDAEGIVAQTVVISLSDRPVEFGVTDAEAVQYFEAFQIEDGACIWELY